MEANSMPSENLDQIMKVSRSRAELYLHLAKGMVRNEFGPATEHQHTEVTVSLAAAMMQHEGAQIVAEALREPQK